MSNSIKFFLLLGIYFICSTASAQNVQLKSIEVNSLGQVTEYRFLLNSGYDELDIIINGNGFTKGLELVNSESDQAFEYYDEYEEFELQSKLSKIGDTEIKYYSSFEVKEKAGKISQIGHIKIDYYTIDPDKVSKLYSIGNIVLKYYIRSQHASLAGKMRSINDLEFDYYTNTVETEKVGSVMQIGKYTFDYYTEYDSRAKIGKLKEVEGEDESFELRVLNLM